METYNGWTNYPTWRVYLEYFDGSEDVFRGLDAAAVREEVESYIAETSEGWAQSLALSFVSDVDWYEIAEHLAETEEA